MKEPLRWRNFTDLRTGTALRLCFQESNLYYLDHGIVRRFSVRLPAWLLVLLLAFGRGLVANAQTSIPGPSVVSSRLLTGTEPLGIPRWHFEDSGPRERLRVIGGQGLISRLQTQSDGEMPHGLIGAATGTVVGGALGYLYTAMHCDNGAACDGTRSILTGAAVGAGVGLIVEYFVRNGQKCTASGCQNVAGLRQSIDVVRP